MSLCVSSRASDPRVVGTRPDDPSWGLFRTSERSEVVQAILDSTVTGEKEQGIQFSKSRTSPRDTLGTLVGPAIPGSYSIGSISSESGVLRMSLNRRTGRAGGGQGGIGRRMYVCAPLCILDPLVDLGLPRISRYWVCNIQYVDIPARATISTRHD